MLLLLPCSAAVCVFCSYVSAMVPVKTMKEYDMAQEVTVLFSETVQRSVKNLVCDIFILFSADVVDLLPNQYCTPRFKNPPQSHIS